LAQRHTSNLEGEVLSHYRTNPVGATTKKVRELAARGAAKTEIVRRVKVSRDSVYRVLKDGRGRGTERLPRGISATRETQGSLPTEDAALVLLFSLMASGQIKLRRIDGWRKIAGVLSQHTAVAA
jgi:hypothetical protein